MWLKIAVTSEKFANSWQIYFANFGDITSKDPAVLESNQRKLAQINVKLERLTWSWLSGSAGRRKTSRRSGFDPCRPGWGPPGWRTSDRNPGWRRWEKRRPRGSRSRRCRRRFDWTPEAGSRTACPKKEAESRRMSFRGKNQTKATKLHLSRKLMVAKVLSGDS